LIAGVTSKCKINENEAGRLTGGAKQFFGNPSDLYHPGIGRMFPEKMVKICSVVVKLLLLICLRTKSSPQQLKKSLFPTYPIIFCEKLLTTEHFLSPEATNILKIELGV
jgi:hypothetical protein